MTITIHIGDERWAGGGWSTRVLSWGLTFAGHPGHSEKMFGVVKIQNRDGGDTCYPPKKFGAPHWQLRFGKCIWKLK